ncbi:hypothetical protein SAMN05421766_10710 [Zobellia uliginosa]|uniref:Uncharacterized protein n=1 Tax=Zobellia uliginosa TaxID=143224 RepID=A0ABY1L0T6_9FLAO|nr:hypothetical protein [Zobellia uliginosa]SIT01231.1 hypothetical protein SAMN05421766_10710 [Zobellia uliginosa]
MIKNLETKKYLTHDELINEIFFKYKESDKKKYTSLFLSSFSTNKLNFRSGLPVFAIMQTFPKHSFKLREGQTLDGITPCEVCSNFNNIEYDTDLIEECFLEVGGLISHSLLIYYYYLLETNKLEVTQPTESDFRIFSEILTILLEANEKDTVKKTIQSKIGKIKGFKSDAEQRQALLETLGYCSILETQEHKGLLNNYLNLAIAPTKTHSSDWKYPVDFWLGKDGINKEAFKFWFGEYSQLDKFWK